MRRLLALTLIGGLLLLSGASTAAAIPASLKIPFCPDCWEYLWTSDAVDANGNCVVCRKCPVYLEAERVSWFWCARGNKWLRAPCNGNPLKRCRLQEAATMALITAGPGVLDRWYCPADRTFTPLSLPIQMRFICKTCARPAVAVLAMERSWYWCEIDGVWAPEACPMSPVKKCCSERNGLLVVYPDLGPISH
jgi:hypothetical protein